MRNELFGEILCVLTPIFQYDTIMPTSPSFFFRDARRKSSSLKCGDICINPPISTCPQFTRQLDCSDVSLLIFK